MIKIHLIHGSKMLSKLMQVIDTNKDVFFADVAEVGATLKQADIPVEEVVKELLEHIEQNNHHALFIGIFSMDGKRVDPKAHIMPNVRAITNMKTEVPFKQALEELGYTVELDENDYVKSVTANLEWKPRKEKKEKKSKKESK